MIAVAQTRAPADCHLVSQILASLAETNRPRIKRLSVEVHEGQVTLRGRVASFYERQIAIGACRAVTGNQRLVDAVEVAAAW